MEVKVSGLGNIVKIEGIGGFIQSGDSAVGRWPLGVGAAYVRYQLIFEMSTLQELIIVYITVFTIVQ